MHDAAVSALKLLSHSPFQSSWTNVELGTNLEIGLNNLKFSDQDGPLHMLISKWV